MKKNKLVFLIMLLILPRMVMASEITDVKLVAKNSTVKVGENVSVIVTINYSDVMKGVNSGYGVKEILYELKFDDKIFVPTAISTSGFDSGVIKYNGAYYGYSEVTEGSDSNKCYDNILYCASYKATITFFVKSTDVTTASISLGEVNVDVYSVEDDDSEATELEYISSEKATITIKKGDSDNVTAPSGIIQYSKPQESSSKTGTSSNGTYVKDNDKSSNAYLKDLTVKGYTLEFYKRTKNYELEVEKGVNTLEIEAKLDDDKALLEIKGADNLKANNYKVEIIVTAQDKSKNTYTITVKEEKSKKKKKLSSVTLVAQAKEMYAQYKLYIFAGIGCLLLIIIVLAIINKASDKKLGNKFDQF